MWISGLAVRTQIGDKGRMVEGVAGEESHSSEKDGAICRPICISGFRRHRLEIMYI